MKRTAVKNPPLIFDGGNVCMICKCVCTPENPKIHPAIAVCKACIEKPINLADLRNKETQARLFLTLGLSIFAGTPRGSGKIRRRSLRRK